MFKKFFDKKTLFILIFVLVALHPLYEVDYLFSANLPFRPTTFINFIIYPLLVLLAFCLFETKKKRVIIFTCIYVLLLIAYFIPHCLTGFYLQDHIHLTNLYYFTVYDEFFYIVSLLLPLAYIYIYNFCDLKEAILEKIVCTMSFVVSIPIVVSNFLKVTMTTYSTELMGNFFDWFSLPFDAESHHPRNYATKFFFKEGNTIGILLVVLLPLMYYFFLKEKDVKRKIFIAFLILTDSISMMMLGTRVASYCALLIPFTVLVVHIFTVIIKTSKFKKSFTLFCLFLTLINAGILPFCPAYQNQQYDAADYNTLKMDDSIRDGYRKGIEEGAEGFEPFSAAWVDYYVYMFEQYKFLMGVTQSAYYEYWYDYHVDPKFWVDLIFDYELEDRVNARQIENIFYKYKWQYLTFDQKLTGFTWSLFMHGGINIEQDFKLQFYSFGYLGFPLIMGPWLVIFLYIIYKFLTGFKKGKWTMFNIIALMSLTLGVVTSCLSGHGFDQLSTNMFIALLCAYLIKNLRDVKNA